MPLFRRSYLWPWTVCAIVASLSSSAFALDSFSLKSGLGLAVQTDGSYSPAADLSLASGRWLFDANVSGYSESQTKVVHVLSGVLYRVPLTQNDDLTTEFGLGAIMAQTTAQRKTETMFNYSFPLGLRWNMFNINGFAMDLNWRSWVFASDLIPLMVLVSHDRITTVGVSVGWSK